MSQAEINNKKFAEDDQKFRAACHKVGIDPTKRQASKYRNGKGLAFKKKS